MTESEDKTPGPDYARLFALAMSDPPSPDEAETEPSLGEIGGHALLEKIGEGGMGVVWKARQAGTGRLVALKQLRFIDAARTAADDETRRTATARFRREIGLAARLEHPGIARVYDTGTASREGEVLFFTMELVDGEPLDRWAAARPDTSEKEILGLTIAICEAVEHAHRNGVIHRDLKPANILVDGDGRPKVLDFGVARALEESEIRSGLSGDDPAATLSLDGEIFGTPAYMAPEQAQGRAKDCDTRSDVYSLGVILFRLLTGGFPYQKAKVANSWELLAQVAEGAVRRPSEVARENGRPRPAPDLEAILMKALSATPDGRYGSAGELAGDLRRYLEGEPVTAQPLTMSYWLRKNISRHRGWWAAGTALFLLLLVFAGAWLAQRNRYLAEQIELREKAETNEELARAGEVRSLVSLARRYGEAGAKDVAIAYLSRAVELDPENRPALASLSIAIRQFATLNRASPTARYAGEPIRTAFSPDGRWFVVALQVNAERRGALLVFDSETCELLTEIRERPGTRMLDLAMAPGGEYAVASLRLLPELGDGGLLVFFGPEGEIARREFDRAGGSLAFSPRGTELAVGLNGRENEDRDIEQPARIVVLDVSNLANEIAVAGDSAVCEIDDAEFPRVGFSQNGQWIYYEIREQDGRVHRFDWRTGATERTEMRAEPEGGPMRHVDFATVGAEGTIAVCGQGEYIAVWRDDGSRPERLWTDRVEGAVAMLSCRFSAGGRYLATATISGKVLVWDARTGERLAELAHGERAIDAMFHPDEDSGIVATMTAMFRTAVWDWRRGRRLGEPIEGGQRVFAMAFDPVGDRILAARDRCARMWGMRPRTWDPVVLECGEDAALDSVAFSAEHGYVVAASRAAKKCYLWRMSDWKLAGTIPHDGAFDHSRLAHWCPPAVSRNGKFLATISAPRQIEIREMGTVASSVGDVAVEPLRIDFEAPLTALAFDRHDRYLAAGDADHEVRVFDLESETAPAELLCVWKGAGLPEFELRDFRRAQAGTPKPIDNFISLIRFAHRSLRLVVVEFPYGEVSAIHGITGAKAGVGIVCSDTVLDLQIAPDDESYVAVGHEAFVRWVSLRQGERDRHFRYHARPISKAGIGADSNRFVTASLDGELSFWRGRDNLNRPSSSFHRGGAPVQAMALTRDRYLCATGDRSGKVRLWLMDSGESLGDPLDAAAEVRDLACHIRHAIFAAACADGKVRLWDIPQGIGRPGYDFYNLGSALAQLRLLADGQLSQGGDLFYFEDTQDKVLADYARDAGKRKLDPEFRPGDYALLRYEIYGLPPLERPVWMVPDTGEERE